MSNAKGLSERVMAAIREPHGNVHALPSVHDALKAIDDDAWWAAMDAGERWPDDTLAAQDDALLLRHDPQATITAVSATARDAGSQEGRER